MAGLLVYKDYFDLTEVKEKLNKRDATCRYCNLFNRNVSSETLKRHIISCCQKVTRDKKLEFINKFKPVSSQVISAKSSHSVQANMTDFVGMSIPDSKAAELNHHLTMFFVTASISFKAVENEHLKQLINSIAPKYTLPSRRVLSNKHLNDEYFAMKLSSQEKINDSRYVSLYLDGWTDCNTRSIYAVNIIFEDRSVHLLGAFDATKESHTGAYIAGK
jgi:hypothetical protein